MDDDEYDLEALRCFCSCFAFFIVPIMIFLFCLFAEARHPGLSIVDFSVPALNKTSNETIIGDIYVDLKLRNKNKVISLYYVDPFYITISFYPLEDPYQRYIWEYTLPPFFQGNGNTKYIRTYIGQPSKVVHNYKEDNTTTGKVVSFWIDIVVSYKYNYWVKGGVNMIQYGAEVVIDAKTGERVSKDRIKLKRGASDGAVATILDLLLEGVEAGDDGSGDKGKKKKKKEKKSDATTSGPHMNKLLFTSLLMYLILL